MRTLWAGALGMALVGCGANPVEQCKDAAAASCKKLFECWINEADRARLMLGASAEACTQSAQARCEPAAGLCESPKRWDGAVASQCVAGYEAISCAELRAGATPSSCAKTCK